MTSFKKNTLTRETWRFFPVFVSTFFTFFVQGIQVAKLKYLINKKNKPWQSLLVHTVTFSYVIFYYCYYKLQVYCKRFQSRQFTCIPQHANIIHTVSNIHTFHQDKTRLLKKFHFILSSIYKVKLCPIRQW